MAGTRFQDYYIKFENWDEMIKIGDILIDLKLSANKVAIDQKRNRFIITKISFPMALKIAISVSKKVDTDRMGFHFPGTVVKKED